MSRKLKDVTPLENKADIPTGDDRWELVLRVSERHEFTRAVKLRNFLQYICRAVITGQTQDVHEQQIGSAVFGRRPDYNPAEDNIVRVEARELRKRLDRYFSGEGAAEPYRIVIPKGTYLPLFEAQSGPLPEERNTASAEPEPLRVVPTGSSLKNNAETRHRKSWRPAWSLLLLIPILLATAYWRMGRRGHPVVSGSAKATDKAAFAGGILPFLFPGNSTIKLVVADSSLAVVEDMTGQRVPLKDYWNRQYLNNLPSNVRMLAQRPFTSLANVMVTSKTLEALLPHHENLIIRHPSDLTIRDIESNNIIFLGSAYSDPWVGEFDSQTNFNVIRDRTTGNLCFANKNPEPGELPRYCAASEPLNTTYAVVTFLPNLQHTGKVLVLEGTTGAGTEAAGNFVTDPYFAGNLAQYLHIKSKIAALPYFEILIKAAVLDKAPSQLQVVAGRILPNL